MVKVKKEVCNENKTEIDFAVRGNCFFDWSCWLYGERGLFWMQRFSSDACFCVRVGNHFSHPLPKVFIE